MNPSMKDEQTIFCSDFQGGNLDLAVKVSLSQYDLFMRVDSNTYGHCNWYYFRLESRSQQTLKLNICNFNRPHNLYDRGLRPYIFRVGKDYDWTQQGQNIVYEQAKLRYEFIYKRLERVSAFSRLSFEIEVGQDETVYLAYCPPYPYSLACKKVRQLAQHEQVQEHSLGRSRLGLNIALLQIGEGSKVVLVTSRIHPGQSNSSYVLDGFIDSLLSEDCSQLRKKITFLVVPMVNPDGVVLGNFRTGAEGKDLNREFVEESECPQVCAIKGLLSQLSSAGVEVLMYLDFHGHSERKNIFFYGPAWPINQSEYVISRVFPRLIGKRTTVFRYHSCSFRIEEYKKSTARAMLFQTFKIPFTYTVESSVASYYCANRMLTFDFTPALFREGGSCILLSLAQFISVLDGLEELRKRRMKKGKQEDQEAESRRGKRSRAEHDLQSIFQSQGLQLQKLLEDIKREQFSTEIEGWPGEDSDAEPVDQDLPPPKSFPLGSRLDLPAKKKSGKLAGRKEKYSLKLSQSKKEFSLLEAKERQSKAEQHPQKERPLRAKNYSARKTKSSSNKERIFNEVKLAVKQRVLEQESIISCESVDSRHARQSLKKSFEMAFSGLKAADGVEARQCNRSSNIERKMKEVSECKYIHIDLRRIEVPKFMARLSNGAIISEIGGELAKKKEANVQLRNKLDEVTKLNRGMVPSAFYKMRKFYNKRKLEEGSESDNESLSIRRFSYV